MSNVWFTSDLHFGHRLVAGHRGFGENTEAHDQGIVTVWNSLVKPVDTVWILGDMSMKGPKAFGPFVEQLNGTLHLIAGNHDAVHPMFRDSHNQQRVWMEFFQSVQISARRRVAGQDTMLSHFPFEGEGARVGPDRHVQWRLRDEGVPVIHGHTHDAQQRVSFSAKGTPMIHVGWDAWGRPVHLDEIAAALDRTAPVLVS